MLLSTAGSEMPCAALAGCGPIGGIIDDNAARDGMTAGKFPGESFDTPEDRRAARPPSPSGIDVLPETPPWRPLSVAIAIAGISRSVEARGDRRVVTVLPERRGELRLVHRSFDGAEATTRGSWSKRIDPLRKVTRFAERCQIIMCQTLQKCTAIRDRSRTFDLGMGRPARGPHGELGHEGPGCGRRSAGLAPRMRSGDCGDPEDARAVTGDPGAVHVVSPVHPTG